MASYLDGIEIRWSNIRNARNTRNINTNDEPWPSTIGHASIAHNENRFYDETRTRKSNTRITSLKKYIHCVCVHITYDITKVSSIGLWHNVLVRIQRIVNRCMIEKNCTIESLKTRGALYQFDFDSLIKST